MIGRGFLLHNLYILQLDQPAHASHFSRSLMVDGDLWYQRLGHPSFDKLKLLSGTLSTSKLNHIVQFVH